MAADRPPPIAADPSPPETVDRVARFVADPDAGRFDPLALEAFAWQYAEIEPFRRLCDKRGATPSTVTDWRAVPPMPVAAFRTLELRARPARETFRSSGTSGGPRSVHHHPFPDLYRRVIDATFPSYCLPPGEPTGGKPPMLSLVPSREELPDSSLSFMIDHVLDRFGGEPSTVALAARGLDFPTARSWLAARQRDRRPGVVLATAFALAELLDRLERVGLRFQLPPGTVLFETGGFKGRTREISRGELVGRVEALLGVPGGQIVREYGMTEMTSQAYSRSLAGGDPDLLVAPPWLAVRALDPETLDEAPPGARGLLAFFDLANVGSAVHLLTEDLGAVEGEDGPGGGFRLLGRAAGAELRGCSLAAEELLSQGG